MKPEITAALLEINRTFYDRFGPAFARTRRRIQPGVRQILNSLPPGGDWLDLGCGSAALALEWGRAGRQGSYTGLDFSIPLLEEAESGASSGPFPGLEIRFCQADLSSPDWPAALQGEGIPAAFDGALAFAVLHHLPSSRLRLETLKRMRACLKPGGIFIHSEWQFHHSARLLERCLPWSTAGLDPADLEEGDTLLDWRYVLPGQAEQVGLRYVHRFSRAELAGLASDCGFKIIDEFESDGEGSRLGLYQVWKLE